MENNLSIAKFATFFVVFWAVMTPLHEWFHLLLLRSFGGNGYIIKTWYGAAVNWTTQPTNHFIAIAYIGGIGVALVYVAMLAWCWYDPFLPELAAALFPWVSGQLAYGIFEGMYEFSMPSAQYISLGGLVFQIGVIIGLLPAIALMALQFANKISEK